MEITDKTLEEMLARGEIIDMGEVEIEDIEIPVDVEEMEIPVHVAEDEAIDQRMIPELVVYTGKAENKQQPVAQEPASNPLFIHTLKIEDVQKRLRNLADYLLPEIGKADRFAKAFGITTERDRIRTFGNYFADFIGNRGSAFENKDYVDPAQFIVKAEIALMNLKNGFEGNSRPIRKNIREVLAEKDEKIYNSIRQRLPEIARAVAITGTGFAVDIKKIYEAAKKERKSPFEYAKDIKTHKQIDELERQLNYR
ncbi:MAG: hypothetical protein WC852_04820 [Candidatus Nanoarchaeia archaeon]|jgi:hypothetical protein